MAYNPYYFSDSDSDSGESHDGQMQPDEEDMVMSDFEKGGDASESTDYYSAPSPAPTAPSSTSAGSSSLASFLAHNQHSSNLSSITSTNQTTRSHSSPANSVISLSESIRTHIYREEYGRGLNNYSEVYRLPADEEEWDRLERQHQMFIRVTGAKYPPPMSEVLKSTTPREKRVLDLGCGDGSWIKDVARDFPYCEAVAVDLVPIADTRDFPQNLRSEVDDINLGLQHFYDKFDVVHCRLISSGVKDYQLLIERMSRVLRPGGLIELVEFDFTAYGRDCKRIPVSIYDPLGPPWWARYLAYIHEAVRVSGGDMDAATHLYTWITSHEAFENVVYTDVWLPAVPGNDTRYSEDVYSMMKSNIIAFMKSGRPLLLGNGLSETNFDKLEQHTIKEVHLDNVPQYTRLQCIYATRRSGVFLSDLQ